MTTDESPVQVDIAVLKRDMAEVKQTSTSILSKLEIMDREYIKRKEAEAIQSALQATDNNMHAAIVELRNIMQTEMIKNAVFRAQVVTWGTVGMTALGLLQFALSFIIPAIFK